MLASPRLLIVDDDPMLLRLLSLLVTSQLEQVLVDTADSPFIALNRVKANAYDVVISDVRMPGMNGIDLASRIGEISPSTAIVLVSEALDQTDRVWSRDIFAYLEKPIDQHEFVRTVVHAIEKGCPQCPATKEAMAVELTLYAHCYGD
jgi:YesN/AraC family two-component response regulator